MSISTLPARPDTTDRLDQATAGDMVRAAVRLEVGAWDALVERFEGMIRSIARSYGLNTADVSDVSQVVWMRLVDHLDRLHDPDRVAGWLATTTRNQCAQVLRQQERTRPTADHAFLDSDDQGVDPETRLAAAQRDARLSQLIESLPSHHQDLLRVMMRDPRPSYQETATALGVPVGSIGPTRQRCLALLRSKCTAAGIEP